MSSLQPNDLWMLYYRQLLETRAAHKGIARLKKRLERAEEYPPPRDDLTAAGRMLWFVVGFAVCLVVLDFEARWNVKASIVSTPIKTESPK